MGKELLLDVDGVVIKRHKYFSEIYSQEHNVPLDEILPFFKGAYKKAAVGEIDIREVLPPYLTKWGWKGSVDGFLKYWFESEKNVDEKVLEVVDRTRENGEKVYLASDNETNRGKYLMKEVGLEDKFDGAFFSYDLGVTKSDPDFFRKIVGKLEEDPSEIEYWDDDPENVEVAKSVGINGNVYTSFEEFEEQLEK